MADSDLTVRITAQDEGTVAMFSNMEARLSALEQAFIKTSTSVDILGVAHKKTGEAAAAHAVANEGLLGSMEGLQHGAAGVITSMELVGASSAGAAQHVRLMGTALKELAASSGPLIIALVALEAAFKAFSFIKDGIADAEKMQSAMATLGAAVQEQGGNWKDAQKGLEDWLNTESLATGFLRTDLIPAINDAVTAGHDLHDSQIMVAAGAEIARAKNVDLSTGVAAVEGAFVGLNRGVLKYDEGLRQLLKTHADQQTILDYLHKKYDIAISDHNNAALAADRQRAAYQAVGEQIGKAFLPAMQAMSESMIGALHNGEEFGKGLSEVFSGIVDDIKAVAKSAYDLALGMFDLAKMDFGGAGSSFKNVGGDAAAGVKGVHEQLVGMRDMWKEMTNGQDAWARGHATVNDAIYAAQHQTMTLDRDGPTHPGGGHGGGHGSGSGSTGYNPPGVSSEQNERPEDINALTAAHNALAQAKADEARVTGVLSTEIATDVTHVTAARTVYEEARKTLDASSKAIDAHNESLKGHGKLSEDDKNKTNELAHAHKAAEIAVRDADTRLKELTKTLAEHEKAALKSASATEKLKTEHEKLTKSITDAKEAADKKLADDIATHGMSETELLGYYTHQYNIAHAAMVNDQTLHTQWDQNLIKLNDETYAKMTESEKAAYDKQFSDLKKSQDDQEKQISSFLDDIIVKHESFSKAFKSIWDKIVSDFIANIAKMLVEGKLLGASSGSGLLGGILSIFGLGGATTASASASTGLSGAAASVLPALISTPQGQGMVVHVASANPGLFGGASSFIAPLTILAGAAGLGGLIGGLEGAGTGAAGIHATNGAIGAGIGAAAGGLGALALGLGGGAFGGLGAGLSMFTPVGWAALAGGALLGGALGGAIGPHWGPSTNYPDRSDTQNYGQFVTDINGQSQAQDFNGTKIAALSQYNTPGTSEGSQMAAWANANPTDPLAQQILGLGKSGSDLFISGEKNGQFTLGDGKQISVTAFEQLGQQFEALGAKATTAAAAVFTLTRAYPDFNAGSLTPNGTFMPAPINITPPGGTSGAVVPGGGTVGSLPGTHINVTVQGSVVGPGGVDDVAQAISRSLNRQWSDSAFGGFVPVAARRGDF